MNEKRIKNDLDQSNLKSNKCHTFRLYEVNKKLDDNDE